MPASLADPLVLPCGARISNRLAKAAITEGLADPLGCPTAELERLYQGWANVGFGLMISGNVIIDPGHLERPGNVIINGDVSELPALRSWTAVATRGGSQFWAQISHSGRQTPKAVNRYPLSASNVAVGLPGGLFGQPQAMSVFEIQEAIDRFASAAAICKSAGFTGVQIHAAHGYLISSFLSPKVNTRTDRWGGPLVNRVRFLMDALAATRDAVGPNFPISVKLNSADFQRGGFESEDSLAVAKMLEQGGVDLIEVSGGSYESPMMIGAQGVSEDTKTPAKKASTVAREAYFLEFARTLRQTVSTPIMLTGGLRSRAGMQAALNEGVDIVGLARPVCVEQACVKPLLGGRVERLPSWEEKLSREKGFFSSNSPIPLVGALTNFAGIYWFYAQLYRLGRGKPADVKLWSPRAMFEVITTEAKILGKRRKLLNAVAPQAEKAPEKRLKAPPAQEEPRRQEPLRSEEPGRPQEAPREAAAEPTAQSRKAA